MTVEYLQEKVYEMETVQKTILLRLENIEKLMQSTELKKRAENPQWEEHSLQEDSDSDHRQCFNPVAVSCLQYSESTRFTLP